MLNYNANNFKQIDRNKIICRMYDLALMMTVPMSSTSKNIDQ